MKLLRLNSEVLEAKYWINLCKGNHVLFLLFFVFFNKVGRSKGLCTYFIAVHAHVVGGDEGLEDHHPAGVGGPLEKRVGHLGDVHVGGVGGRHQVCKRQRD